MVVIGLRYWPIPYAQASLPSSLYGIGLWLVAAAALVLRLAGVARSWKIALVVGSAPAAAVLMRVVRDTVGDPTSHNLWPIELVIALALGAACAGAGVVAAKIVLAAWTMRQPQDKA